MTGTSSARDPTTVSNYDRFRTRHIAANFNIDFAKEQLRGKVILDLEVLKKSNEIVLDTSYLDVTDIKVDGSSTNWTLEARTEPYGSPLKIQSPSNVAIGQHVNVSIDVATTKKCTALQWMKPEQTSNKRHPYMFSQCQAIHARSVFPCQDTPDVKATVDFNLRSPLPVLASGLPSGSSDFKPGSGDTPGTLLYSFKQEVPIPSYLFAIASGDIATASIGPRSVVAAGPEELCAAKWELEDDMERFIEAAEKIVKGNPYAWTTYNVLFLPASFPYGGMENPIFTFATPTIISGDRENIDVIAHELSHSWSGNLVSCASWEHFWLNEGWTTYLERRIQAEIHGEPHRGFSAIIGWKALSDSIENFGKDHRFTKMVVDLKEQDPDDSFSSVPYEKGFVFLYHLENLVGKSKFDEFISHYFSTFAQKSLDSFEFKETILSFFAHDKETSKRLVDLDWDAWYYRPGYPPKPEYDTSLVDVVYSLADQWEARARQKSDFAPSREDIKGLSANQLVVFLERVATFETSIRAEDSQAMDAAYSFSSKQNVEITSRYFRVAMQAQDSTVNQPTAELLGKVGRMKFVRPLYRYLEKADRDLALKTFEKNESFYHPICRQLVKQQLYGTK
ncbi:hypothetical protein MMC10_004697 [Thelotrema lepadinum]|nr:hypothetical protein [Thelotrema lepadinum]